MKAQIIAVVVTAILAAISVDSMLRSKNSSPADQYSREQFEKFIASFGRNYASPAEKEYRFKIFSESIKEILQVNSANFSYRFGVNDFSDMTQEEIKAKFTGLRP